MEQKIIDMVEQYQCPGCVCGGGIECYEKADHGIGCGKHCAGTTIYPSPGRIFLGMPKGFCRIGESKSLTIHIFEGISKGWKFDKFNVPVWKHLDEHGNTLVRGLSPRINSPFLHIFIGDCLSEIDCLEITNSDLAEMD